MECWRATLAALAAALACTPLAAAEEGVERSAWIGRVERARRQYEAFATRAWESFAAGNVAFARQNARAPASYAEDGTLREGDVVMTDRGMVVCAGASPGGPRRFKALEAWRGDEKRHADLLQMQKASVRDSSESPP
jgi:hypothetical protein